MLFWFIEPESHFAKGSIKYVRTTLQKQHAEYVFLKLGGIHLATQNISGRKEMTLQLGQGEFGHDVHAPSLMYDLK